MQQVHLLLVHSLSHQCEDSVHIGLYLLFLLLVHSLFIFIVHYKRVEELLILYQLSSENMRFHVAGVPTHAILLPNAAIVHNEQIAKSIPNSVFLILSLFYSISINIAV